MNSLDYLKRASRFAELAPADFGRTVKINLITNFTDDILKNVFAGVNLCNAVYPVIHKTPYRQYHLELKNDASALFTTEPDLTFIFFDINPFEESAFKSSQDHFDEILADLEGYCKKITGTVVFNHFVVSYQGAYGNLFRQSPFFNLVHDYNRKIDELADRTPNLMAFDTNRIVHLLGEANVFDLRGLYAFDIPFTQEFMTVLAEEWFTFVRALYGGVKKCIVLDLDNTLWGGVVGELGPHGIALGPDYPGNAFMNFQRALLDFYNRGIVLAINSKNNLEDVREVFEKNPNMVLKENHFAAIRANWEEKAQNIESIAQELNIGTESMVFFDDDRFQREMMRDQHPEVGVPDFSIPPEDYAWTLYALDVFNQPSLTEEDLQKGKMYAEERQRKEILKTTKDMREYIAELGIGIRVTLNDERLIPRISQLTQKTNQFNVTTKRYSEGDIRKLIEGGARVFSGNVSDKFGDYGTVILAIALPDSPAKGDVTIDTFLMSCRVMGRGVECRFLDYLVDKFCEEGFIKLHGSFVPTAKNKSAENFFTEHGFKESKTKEVGVGTSYILSFAEYAERPCVKVNKAITITI
jgi:FkbH-like protein